MLGLMPDASSSAASVDINVTITNLDEHTKNKFPREVGKWSRLEINYICVAETVKAFLDLKRYPKFGSGDILARNDAGAALDLLSNNLKGYSGGAVVSHSQFTMILYPLGQQAWNFLDSKALPHSDARLRYHIMAPFIVTPANPVSSKDHIKSGESPSRAISRIALGLDMKRLFEWTYCGEVAKNVFLMFHPRYNDEIALLTTFFQNCGAKVYHGAVEGSWTWFCDKISSGVVLVSPEKHLYQVPRQTLWLHLCTVCFAKTWLCSFIPTFTHITKSRVSPKK